MERVVWVIGNNRADMIEAQRKLNSSGGLRALCMLSFEKLLKEVENQGNQEHSLGRTPTLIILDYETMKAEEHRTLSILKNHQGLQGVPLFFMVRERSHEIDEECYDLGAMVVLHIPFTKADLTRIERIAWQTEVTRNYEKMLQKQASDLQSAREIWKLNHQLETRNQILSQIFGRYFSDDVADVILDNPDGAVIGGEKKRVTVMMADLRGFTSVSENMDPVAVTDLLCFFFEQMVDAIQKYHGTVIEFLGDGILAVFGAPVTTKDHTADAIAAAVSMQNKMISVNEYCESRQYPEMELGIGLHAGEVFIGNIGSEKMMRYNVIGSAVNECSRIESTSVGGQIFISESSVRGIPYSLQVRNRRQVAVKGIKKPLEICQITGIGAPYECYQSSDDEEQMQPVAEEIICGLCPMDGKTVGNRLVFTRLECISTKEARLRYVDDPGSIIERYAAKKQPEVFVEKRKLEILSDVEITAKCGKTEVFKGIYGKVVESDPDGLLVHFTRVNKELQTYVKTMGTTRITEDDMLYGFQETEKNDWCIRGLQREDQDFLFVEMSEESAAEYEQKFAICQDEIQAANERIKLFRRLKCRMLLMSWQKNEETHLLFLSDSARVRALEFMDFLLADFGLIRGDSKCASGVISNAVLKVKSQSLDLAETYHYLLKMTDQYFQECLWIDCAEYSLTHQTDILQMDCYQKKKVMWAYVKSTDVAKDGDEIRFKSLENESGVLIPASEDLYIMIGCRGEVYHIKKAKFDAAYQESEEPLDVFEQMLDYIPEISRNEDQEYVSLDEVAHLCYPKKGPGIYAKKLDRRTKVFPVGCEDYFLGREGDYLAVRCDDLSDMYIIQGDIFKDTYELRQDSE